MTAPRRADARRGFLFVSVRRSAPIICATRLAGWDTLRHA
nr:MAG TPA: hypothetical protein [Caudoviricetes sp.]